MPHHQLDFADLMRKQGHRVTPQRQLILDAICESGGHTTPEEIYERVKRKSPSINQATIYRTLDFLSELGLVVSGDIGIGQKVYELAGITPHHHLVCERCHQVQELEHDMVANLFAQIETQNNSWSKQIILFSSVYAIPVNQSSKDRSSNRPPLSLRWF